MATIQYVAFLRGINVGGKSIIKMADLKACLAKEGFENIATYIQSGNVLFESDETDAEKLVAKFNKTLLKAFDYKAPTMLRTHKQMKDTVAKAPKGFGTEPDKYRYDVIFLREPLTPAKAHKELFLREGVDEAATGPGVLYFSRLVAKITSSQLNCIVGTPNYKNMTIRNWNTTTKMLALLDTRK
jgi:uncharacterized protein (DUF1697 family)